MEGLKPGEKYAFKFYRTMPLMYKNRKGYGIAHPYRVDTKLLPYTYIDIGDPIVETAAEELSDEGIAKNKINHLAKPVAIDDPFYGTFSMGYANDAPHRGISVIGLSDPKYSLYSFDDLDRIMSNNLYRGNVQSDDKHTYKDAGLQFTKHGKRGYSGKYIFNNWPFYKLSSVYRPVAFEIYKKNVLYSLINSIKKSLPKDYALFSDDRDKDDRLREFFTNLDRILDNTNSANDTPELDLNGVISYIDEHTSKTPIEIKRKQEFIDDYIKDRRQWFKDNAEWLKYRIPTMYKNPPTDTELTKSAEKEYAKHIKDKLSFNLSQAFDIQNSEPLHNKLYTVEDTNINGLPVTSYINLLKALHNTGRYLDDSDLWLAAVPVKSLYNRDDLQKNVLRGQRDYPEELVTRKLRLLKDIYDPYESIEREHYTIKHGHQTHPIQEELSDLSFYAMGENDAKKWIEEHFDIDPHQIVSDELCKEIYDDMSKDFEKQNSQHNIVNGLSGGDNKWR